MEFKNGYAEVTLADGTRVGLRERTWRSHPKPGEFWAKTRVFIDHVEHATPGLAEAQAALPAPKVRGEDPENDRAYDAYNRAYMKAAREHTARVLAEVPAIPADAAKGARFSRKAGCSFCPCSPGLILATRITAETAGVDIYITLPRPTA